jgi:hypothetical protein
VNAAKQHAARLRTAGVLILLLGVASAGARYWIGLRSAEPTLEDLAPGSTAAKEREVAILIGGFGVNLLQGWAYLQRPDAQAIILVVVSGVTAYVCFRIAALLAQDRPGP